MDGMRKFYLAVIAVGAMLLGLLIMVAFKAFKPSMWTAWCTAVAGIAGAYMAANVVTKKVEAPPKKGKKKGKAA